MAPEFKLMIQKIGRVVVQIDKETGSAKVIGENGAPRVNPTEQDPEIFVRPEGAIKSLRILARPVYIASGIKKDEDYWNEVDAAKTLTPTAAWNLIQRSNRHIGGVTYEAVARAVLQEDPELAGKAKLGPMVPALAGRIMEEIRKSKRRR